MLSKPDATPVPTSLSLPTLVLSPLPAEPPVSPNVRMSRELGLSVAYSTNAKDLNVSATGSAFAWTRQDEAGAFPGLIFVTHNLLEMRPIEANHPVAIALESNQERVITGSSDGAIERWDARTGMRDLEFGKVAGQPTSIALSVDDKRIAAGARGRYEGGDGSVTVWTQDEPNATKVYPAYGAVTRVSFAPGSNELYFSTSASSCSRGGGGVFVAKLNGAEVKEVYSASGNPVLDFAIHPQGKMIASVGETGTARCTGAAVVSVWDATNGNVTHVLSPTVRVENAQPVNAVSVAYSPDGKRLAVGDSAGNLSIWDWEKEILEKTYELSSGPLSRVQWTAANVLILNDTDGYVRLLQYTP